MEKLLVIENVQPVRDQLKAGLCQEFAILEGKNRQEAMDLFTRHLPKVALLDLDLAEERDGSPEGFRCLEAMVKNQPTSKIIVLTGDQERERAYRAVACGAYDFFHKPVDLTELKIIVRRAYHLCRIEEQGRRLQEALKQSSAGIDGIAFKCAAIQELLAPLQTESASAQPEDERVGAVEDAQELVLLTSSAHEADRGITAGHLTLREVRDRVEKSMIHAAVDNCGGNMAKASELLGVSRPALYDLLKKHGLFKPVGRP